MGDVHALNLLSVAGADGVQYLVAFTTDQGPQCGQIKTLVVTLPKSYDFSKDITEMAEPQVFSGPARKVRRRFEHLKALVAEVYKPYHVLDSDAEDYSPRHMRIISWSRMGPV